MQLKTGILIHNQLKDGYDAITINSGTVFHTEQVASDVNFKGLSFRPQYDDRAYVPRRDWRHLSGDEIGCLQANGLRNEHNTVYLGDIPEPLKACFYQSGVADAGNEGEVFERLRGDEKKTKDLSAALSLFLTPLAGNQRFHFHCIGTNYPNLEMVAFNLTKLPVGYRPEDIRFLGMHNDGREKMTLHTAYKYGNRICINLGKDSRWFLFVNLSVIQAVNMLKKKIDVKKEGVNLTNIRTFFFKHFPGYPVIRIQQKPYQYYIAPTYNCFHDGSTMGSREQDITIIYFGNFKC